MPSTYLYRTKMTHTQRQHTSQASKKHYSRHPYCTQHFEYMLCTKFGLGQSLDCPRNPWIALKEVRKVWMKDNSRIARVPLSLYCRQVIDRSRMYCMQDSSINVDVQGKAERRNLDQKLIVLGKVEQS